MGKNKILFNWIPFGLTEEILLCRMEHKSIEFLLVDVNIT